MIARRQEAQTVRRLLARNPVVGIVGARQVGKTTLARYGMAGTKKPPVYFDLENPEDLARFADPMLMLKIIRLCFLAVPAGRIFLRSLAPLSMWREDRSRLGGMSN